jgi:hypothetical protein
MIRDFFLWCSGCDKNILTKCEEYVVKKYTMLGVLVVIPAILGLISMSYALSTINNINKEYYVHIIGGIVWSLIIFSFDRFVVSTHIKKEEDIDELKSISFYLRIIFAFILGVVVSHPFVMFYFEGSITEKLQDQKLDKQNNEYITYLKEINDVKVNQIRLENDMECLQMLLTAEKAGGGKVSLPCGITSGYRNVSEDAPSTNEVKRRIEKKQTEIDEEKQRIRPLLDNLSNKHNNNKVNIKDNFSTDYLKREIAFSEIKKTNPIATLTELLIIISFILLDILPLVFKTFSSYTSYDKILGDTKTSLKNLDIEKRKETLQKLYDDYHSEIQNLSHIKKFKSINDVIDDFFSKSEFKTSSILGIILGITISIILIIQYEKEQTNITYKTILQYSSVSSILFSIIATYFTRIFDFIISKYKNNER